MKKYLIAIVTISMLLTACRKENKLQETQITIPVAMEQFQKDYPFAEKFHYSKLIPLETTEQCRIGDIQRVFSVDSSFVVWDGKKVALFDSDGSYISNVGHQGRASNEYMRISDVNVDYNTKEIYLLDNSSLKILVYGIRGDFKRRISMKNYATGFLLTHNQLWLENYALDGAGKMLLCTDINTNEIQQGHFPFLDGEKMPIRKEKSFFWGDSVALFASSYMNTIYKIAGDEITPYVKINFLDNKADESNDMTKTKFFQKIAEENYIGYVKDVYQVNSYLFFSFNRNNAGDTSSEFHVCYNMDSRDVDIYDFSLLHDSRIPVSPSSNIIGVYGDGVIFSLDISALPDFLLKKLKENTGLENLNNISNPILILYDVY